MFLIRSEILPEKDFDFNSSDNTRETILLDELDYDLQAFKYLLESSYSGYEDAVERGLDLEKMAISVRKKFEKEMFVGTEKLAESKISAFIKLCKICADCFQTETFYVHFYCLQLKPTFETI